MTRAKNYGKVRTSRSSVALCLALFAAVLNIGLTAGAATMSIYGIVANPGENCSTQMNLGWHADLAFSNCVATYTKKSDTTWAHAATVPGTNAYCDAFDGIYSKTAAGADYYESAIFRDYGAVLTGLEPDTDYMYKICTGTGVCSPVHYFKTAGAAEFSFVWISDFHAYAPLPDRLNCANKAIKAALAIDPAVDFIFSTGDTIAWGGSYSFWTNMYTQDFVKNYMFASVLGNHDAMTRTSAYSSNYFRIMNNFPWNGYAGEQGVCYWFLYNNALFLMLNTEAMNGNAAEEAAAKNWAAGVIQRLRGQYQYVFLAEHYMWFFGENGKTFWYANWKDFCDQYGVTLALAGHDHIYERTYPLYHDQVATDGKGTVYMVAPSSDGDRGAEAGALVYNSNKLACTYSSHTSSGGGQVKTIGCVLVKVGARGITTKLVYLDDNKVAHVADESTFAVPPARNPGHFDSVWRLADGSIRLNMSGTAGSNYLVQWSSNWREWSNFGVFSSTNGSFSAFDSITNASQRFYRLQPGP
jgi:hypothetical protein